MNLQLQLEQLAARLDKLQAEITNTEYFMNNASCKETKDIYLSTLREKQNELRALVSKKDQLVSRMKVAQ